ncbi:DUF3221 domain-containing protein [Cytobacillus suaedae]|nr:DUF3221 domain-containing protein [Cytobacillus suaedae]
MKKISLVLSLLLLALILFGCNKEMKNETIIDDNGEKEIVEVIGFVNDIQLDEKGYVKEIFLITSIDSWSEMTKKKQEELGLDPTAEETMIVSFSEHKNIDIKLGNKVKVSIVNRLEESAPPLATGIDVEVVN